MNILKEKFGFYLDDEMYYLFYQPNELDDEMSDQLKHT